MHAKVIFLLALAANAYGQDQRAYAVHGVAYDSLHMRVVAGGTVVLTPGSRLARTDSVGRFSFDSLAPGNYQVTLDVPDLDLLGSSNIQTSLVISDADRPLFVYVPS